MKKAEQTEALKIRLYDLTLQFVRKYQPRYYKQYRGEHDDLAMDFYCNFLTPKARIAGNEETLLDKFDDSITSLEYLVKIAVRNMLIDRSRSNPVWTDSIDQFVDEFGDFITASFNLTTDQEEEETIDTFVFNDDFVEIVKVKFNSLDEKTREKVVKYYQEVGEVLSPNYKSLFQRIIKVQEKVVEKIEELSVIIKGEESEVEAIVYQVTSKTICCLVGNSIKEFNRFTGEARGKAYKNLKVVKDSLNSVFELETYHCGKQRSHFLMN